MDISELLNPSPTSSVAYESEEVNSPQPVVYNPQPVVKELSPNTDQQKAGSHRTAREYSEEDLLFLWYHFIDLKMTWEECLEAFKNRFPEESPTTGSIKRLFYRYFDGKFPDKKRRRILQKMAPSVFEVCERHYPWMPSSKPKVTNIAESPNPRPTSSAFEKSPPIIDLEKDDALSK
ncbi:hypothetical protein TSTA_107770 [Talaromyces stipitatus ATCC 10500]|uniref:Uncharacterized protein n=1 Tax=Talaromyces stipitatus (strain ATCC 10500 / CBS 375.48 / QM 6759 / NRRL 1006) TaxID=441959 RepID=B8MU82_TALSN|nr:uncharacterized protein TSTA_107770 [Talaromyces stipitatus ATCC 10500]EED11586.1 hypothetical protein TSTA_107770 [Talaromyces stipitatus ATCC 10500]